jgi:hypothetical protein
MTLFATARLGAVLRRSRADRQIMRSPPLMSSAAPVM